MVSALVPITTGIAPIVIGNIHSQQMSVIGLIILPVQVLAKAPLSNKTLDITTTTDILNKCKTLEMNEKRIVEELTFFRLLLTILSAITATLTGFIGGSVSTLEDSVLLLSCGVDLLLVAFMVFCLIKIIKLLKLL